MELSEFYSEIGVDSQAVVRRLGLTEKHLKKYLRKFLVNPEFEKLSRAVAEKDYYNVELAAHTIKGVASNLGLNILFDDFQKIVNCVRTEKTEEVPELFEAASADYERIIELLAQVDLGAE